MIRCWELGQRFGEHGAAMIECKDASGIFAAAARAWPRRDARARVIRI